MQCTCIARVLHCHDKGVIFIATFIKNEIMLYNYQPTELITKKNFPHSW